jgi:hypothetical protein
VYKPIVGGSIEENFFLSEGEGQSLVHGEDFVRGPQY